MYIGVCLLITFVQENLELLSKWHIFILKNFKVKNEFSVKETDAIFWGNDFYKNPRLIRKGKTLNQYQKRNKYQQSNVLANYYRTFKANFNKNNKICFPIKYTQLKENIHAEILKQYFRKKSIQIN